MAIALVPTATNAMYASRAGDYAARDFAYNLLQSVEPYGVLITNGDNDTFPLWYLQEVEGIRRDVTVIVMSYFNTPWYVRQLRDLTPAVRPARARRWRTPRASSASGRTSPRTPRGIYGNPRAPTRPILHAVGRWRSRRSTPTRPASCRRGLTFEARGHDACRCPTGQELYPAHHLVLLMMQGAWGDRPIYFAATTNTHLELGLVRAGGAAGARVQAAAAGGDGGARAHAHGRQRGAVHGRLLRRAPATRRCSTACSSSAACPTRAVWPDDATRNIPMQYYYAFAAGATAAQLRQDAPGTERYTQRATGFADLANER